MLPDWTSMLSSNLSKKTKMSEKTDETGNLNSHTAYESSNNNGMACTNLSSKSNGFTNNLTYTGKTLPGSCTASAYNKRKQLNREMREKLILDVPKPYEQRVMKSFNENFAIHELPCHTSEGGKWTKIRMYQERARRRKARRRRQRENEREESSGRKSKRRKSRKRSKSRKRRKSRKRSTSRKRGKSKKRSKSRRRRRSRSRKKSGKSKRKTRKRSKSTRRRG